MANHKSSIKRIRQTQKRKVHNKYYARTTRNAIKALRETSEKAKATEDLSKVFSMVDKLAKKNILHKNKAANIKSSLTKKVNSLA